MSWPLDSYLISILPKRRNTCLLCVDKQARIDNLKEVTAGWTGEAIELVYDDILRYNKAKLFGFGDYTKDTVDFDNFKKGVLWWADNVAGMESDWRQDVLNTDKVGNTAYGYTQITKDTLPIMAEFWGNSVIRYNKSAGKRLWSPMHSMSGSLDKKKTPEWVEELKTSKDHIASINNLTYDQVIALTIVHAKAKSKDEDWVALANGDESSCKEIYNFGHHTRPTIETIARAQSFFLCKKNKKPISSWFSIFN
jgi:hypothetical protein